jgi:putative heme-binding domain-containing protein
MTGDNTSKPAPNPALIPISGRDFRFRPDTGEFEAESGQAQYGRRRDDWGRWFANNNSTWLWHYTVSDRYLRRNPTLAVKSVRKTLANYEASTRVFPISAQPVRFNQPQSLGHVTSACSPSPYRDELYGEEFATSFFICEPVHNAIHREVLVPDGATFSSRRAESERDREFLASEDVWFRPAMIKTGPDGWLYIADMYRFVLEHPEWIAPETQSRLDLRAGEDKGRIYRVSRVPKRIRTKPWPPRQMPELSKLSTSELVTALDSPNGWQRDTVQRLLYERWDQDAAVLLEKLARSATHPKVRLHAIATLDLLGVIKPETVIAALRDPEPAVRLTALRVSESLAGKSDSLLAEIAGLASDSQFIVRHQLAFTLGEWKSPVASATLTKLAERDGSDPQMRVAILSSVPRDSPLMTALREDAPKKSAAATPRAPVFKPSTPDRAKVIATFVGSTSGSGDQAHGAQIYRQLCSACHRFKGEGREVGPDLATIAGKPEEWLLAAVFDPNQAIEARYEAQHVKTKDGTELLGLVVGETANNITLRTAEGTDRAVLRTDIQEIKPLGRSLMPEGVEGALKPQDFADLIKFLRAP